MDNLNKQVSKITFIINWMLTIFVIAFGILFYKVGATYITYFSIGALFFYFPANIIIAKNKYFLYIMLLYIIITLYMFATTICLGINPGFQMYCLSMIPLLFYCDYLGEKMGVRRVKPLLISIFIAVAYIGCTSYVLVNGPIYSISSNVSVIMLALNSMWVIGLLIFYSGLMVRLIRESEQKLKKQAMSDKLTGLYNRHFMIDQLKAIESEKIESSWVSILDIDNFKSVNDTYGHNAGDAVLVGVSEIIREVCQKCMYARWGGEEFLVLSDKENDMVETLEGLRKRVSEKLFVYEGKEISVTITLGAGYGRKEETVDAWINRADNLLYEGKHSGKNKLVIK